MQSGFAASQADSYGSSSIFAGGTGVDGVGIKPEVTDVRVLSARDMDLWRLVQAVKWPTWIDVMLWELSVCRIGTSAPRKK